MPFNIVKYKRGWRVKDDKGNYYSKKPLTKKNARQQQKALYASESRKEHLSGAGVASYMDDNGEYHIVLTGEGWFADVWTKIKSIGRNVASAVATVPLQKASDILSSNVRTNYPPKARDTLGRYGSGEVYDLLIVREPIQSYINTALNIITLGRWNEAKRELNYDKLFHLSMIASLAMPNGEKVRVKIEKNEVINITSDFSLKVGAESIRVPVPCCITLLEMMGKTQEVIGPSFFYYDAFNNNCQIFLLNILRVNGLLSQEADTFINQNAEQLLQKLPSYTKPFAKTLTSIAGVANRIFYGEGMIMEAKGMNGGRIYCGLKERTLPPGDRKGNRLECFKKGVGVGMMLESQKEKPLDQMTIRELGQEASKRKIKGYSKMKRQELIDAIRPLRGGSAEIPELNADGSWSGDFNSWSNAGFPGCGPNSYYEYNADCNTGCYENGEPFACVADKGKRQTAEAQVEKYKDKAQIRTAIQDEDTTKRVFSIDYLQQAEQKANDDMKTGNIDWNEVDARWKRYAGQNAIDQGWMPVWSVEWLNSVEGRHLREADPYFDGVYRILLQQDHTAKNRLDERSKSDYEAQLENTYQEELNRRYGTNEEIYSPEAGYTLTDSKGVKQRVNKVRLRQDGGYDIQFANGLWEYQAGENDWDCNEYQKGDRYEDIGVCGTEGRRRAGEAKAQNIRAERDREWDGMSGWDKFKNGLAVIGSATQDYVIPIASTVASFIPGVGQAISTGLDIAGQIAGAFTEGECRHFNECTDQKVEVNKARSLYHKTKGDSVAQQYLNDDNWAKLLEGNTKVYGLLNDTLTYGSRAGKLYQTGSGQSSSRVHPMDELEAEIYRWLSTQPEWNYFPNRTMRMEFVRITAQMVREQLAEEEEDDNFSTVSNASSVSIEPEMEGGSVAHKFYKQLKTAGFTPEEYLKKVRQVANENGYDGRAIEFSDDEDSKLMIYDDEGRKVRFGKVGYGDFLIWSKLEEAGKVRKGYAEMKRRVFRKSHSSIKGDWKANKFSPNNLSIKILW